MFLYKQQYTIEKVYIYSQGSTLTKRDGTSQKGNEPEMNAREKKRDEKEEAAEEEEELKPIQQQRIS